MDLTDMILVTENDKGTEVNMLMNLDDYKRYIEIDDMSELAEHLHLLGRTLGEEDNFTEYYRAANVTISARFCKDDIQLGHFLQGLADIKMKCKMFLNMREVVKNESVTEQKTLNEQIQSMETTLKNIENAWKNIYSEYADRKLSKEEYLEKTKEYREKKAFTYRRAYTSYDKKRADGL